MNKRGFSLLEVVIALFILSVAIFAILGLQNTALKQSGQTMRTREATDLAKASVEQLRAVASQANIAVLPNCGLPATAGGFVQTCSATPCATISSAGFCTNGSPVVAWNINIAVSANEKQYLNLSTTVYKP